MLNFNIINHLTHPGVRIGAVYEGPVAGGTGTQVYVPNPRASGVKLINTQPLPNG